MFPRGGPLLGTSLSDPRRVNFLLGDLGTATTGRRPRPRCRAILPNHLGKPAASTASFLLDALVRERTCKAKLGELRIRETFHLSYSLPGKLQDVPQAAQPGPGLPHRTSRAAAALPLTTHPWRERQPT